ncbi:hypothetical protein NXS98_07545 [Fontisphaera persica]|uniref:hypothetical protein n=1 Tax=Fontisphaera persica TaxID=2974023 RepID=UPI0024BF21A9|nr:hypothetical protein [Fontisphaera persica]WCJ60964.1 hypothetical protein NXS98_07545 [Fontisphaera persica]
MEWKSGASPRITHMRRYDRLQRLVEVVNAPPPGQVAATFLYGYNLANQRTAVTNTGGCGGNINMITWGS